MRPAASLDKPGIFRQWRRAACDATDSLRAPWFGESSSRCSLWRPSPSGSTTSRTSPTPPEFVISALALIPLAWLIGEATEHAAEHTGPGIGGFLNATFGNAPELIIALIAVNEGLTEVVRGSLTGSVVSNLLLVLGAALVAGGKGQLDRYSSFVAFGLLGCATLLFLIPAIPGWEGDPDRDSLAKIAVPVSIVLLIVYMGVTWYSLRRHARLHVASDEEIVGWSLRRSLVALFLATVATAFVAEVLVGSIEVFSEKVGLSEFFVAAVIVAIVGNAAEHGGAVVVAFRGKIALAGEIALSSAAQVAVFLIPAVALLSWLIDPLALELPAGRDRSARRVDPLHRHRPLQRAFEPLPRGVAARRLRRRGGRVLPRRRPLSRLGREQEP